MFAINGCQQGAAVHQNTPFLKHYKKSWNSRPRAETLLSVEKPSLLSRIFFRCLSASPSVFHLTCHVWRDSGGSKPHRGTCWMTSHEVSLLTSVSGWAVVKYMLQLPGSAWYWYCPSNQLNHEPRQQTFRLPIHVTLLSCYHYTYLFIVFFVESSHPRRTLDTYYRFTNTSPSKRPQGPGEVRCIRFTLGVCTDGSGTSSNVARCRSKRRKTPETGTMHEKCTLGRKV